MVIPDLNNLPSKFIYYLKDADALIFALYAVSSFFERYINITYRLYTTPADAQLAQISKPCYIEIRDLPKLKSVRYTNTSSNLDANNMSECNLEAWTTVTILSQNLYEVKFPNGELIPISPKNARDNRIYYKRRTTKSLWRAEPLYWLVLRIQTGALLSDIRKSVWLLPITNSHIFDHKYLSAPPVLRPQYTPMW